MNIFKRLIARWDKENKFISLRYRLFGEWKALRDELTHNPRCRVDFQHTQLVYRLMDCRLRAMNRIVKLREAYKKKDWLAD